MKTAARTVRKPRGVKTGGERAFVYAKSAGLIAASFLARGAPRLLSLSNPTELENLIFGSVSEPSSGTSMADLEKHIMARTVSHIYKILDAYKGPADFLVRLVRNYEYADVKLVLQSLVSGDENCPAHTDLREYTTVNFAAYPDAEKMFRGTEFSFLIEKIAAAKDAASPSGSLESLYEALNRQYYALLWQSLHKVARRDTATVRALLHEEIILKNIVCALRLRSYYHYTAEEVLPVLIDVERGRDNAHSLTQAATDTLARGLDNPADWRDWKYRALLNREKAGQFWRLDPRYVQNAAAVLLYNKARLAFRRHPFALDTTAVFIRLKQFEEQILCSVAEALRLGMKSGEVLAALGIGGGA